MPPPDRDSSNAATLPLAADARTIADRIASAGAVSPVVLDDPELQRDERQRYQTVQTLGVGGMGEVRLSHDRRIGREVAMKVIHEDQLQYADSAARFLREARIQGQLEHPSIVPVYDLGTGPGGPYFTMKRIRGLTLEQILAALREGDPSAEQAYPTRRLLSAMSTVCLAVAFAHARSVLHRDLKPANVMLGAFGEVHVLDWGLAKLAREPADEPAPPPSGPARVGESEPGATAVGSMMGTPGYMAPEQAMGEWDRVDARADVYALGAILFEVVTLEPLHVGDRVVDLIASTLAGAEARPSVRVPARPVAPEIESIILKATARSPADRYPSARELAEAIERFLDGSQDLERRRAMADAHAEAASAAARVAAQGDDDARPLALREAGRALALLPTHRGALATLARVLLSAPKTIPKAAEAEFAERSRVIERSSARGTLMLFVSWVGFLPIALLLGVRSVSLFAIGCAVVLFGVAAAYTTYRRNLGGRARLFVYALGCAFILMTSFVFGPLILTPNLAVTHALAFFLTGERRYRGVAVSLAAATIAVPFVAEVTGIGPPAYAFQDGAMTVLPRLVSLTQGPALALLSLANLMLVVATPLFAGRVRDAVDAAERRTFLDSWSLRQLLPEGAHPSPTEPPPPSSRAVPR